LRPWRAFVAAIAIAGASGCAVFGPPQWTDYYDPRYPDHQAAYELCEAASADEASFAHCMLDAITPHGAPASSLATRRARR